MFRNVPQHGHICILVSEYGKDLFCASQYAQSTVSELEGRSFVMFTVGYAHKKKKQKIQSMNKGMRQWREKGRESGRQRRGRERGGRQRVGRERESGRQRVGRERERVGDREGGRRESGRQRSGWEKEWETGKGEGERVGDREGGGRESVRQRWGREGEWETEMGEGERVVGKKVESERGKREIPAVHFAEAGVGVTVLPTHRHVDGLTDAHSGPLATLAVVSLLNSSEHRHNNSHTGWSTWH